MLDQAFFAEAHLGAVPVVTHEGALGESPQILLLS